MQHPDWNAYSLPPTEAPLVVTDPSLPLVSVVTPSYNQGRFIGETIESVLSQDYPNIEYWVIDGGSTDNTVDILKSYAHEPRLNWISERDRGQSDAINKGWRRCRGEIVAWLNSDDTYLPHAIRTQVAALQQHPDCGIVYGDAVYTDQSGTPLFTFYGRPYSVPEVLRLSVPIQPTTFLRRSVCEQIGPVDERFRFSMDSEYWARAARVTDFWYQPAAIATYRLHEQSKTVGDFNGFYNDWLNILQEFFADPALAKRYRAERTAVYADVFSTIAAKEFQYGSLTAGLRYAGKSIATGAFSKRLLTVMPALLDRYLPFDTMSRVMQWGTYRKSGQQR